MRYLDISLECNGETLTFGTNASQQRREFAVTVIRQNIQGWFRQIISRQFYLGIA